MSIAPHKLNDFFISQIIDEIRSINLPIYILEKDASEFDIKKLFENIKKKPGVLLITIPGILCEMYTNYGHVFVGGGHGRSIHSVLEPFIASRFVYCGPKVFRSTEFDFIKKNSPQSITIVEKLDGLYDFILENNKLEKIDAKEDIVKELVFQFDKIATNLEKLDINNVK